MDRNKRKIYTGVVVSDKMNKTITIEINTYKKDRLYGKNVKVSKKFHVHDELEIASIGDLVSVMETRPLSKTKRFRVLEVLKKAEV